MKSVALLANPESGSGEAEIVQRELVRLGAAVDVHPIDEWERAVASPSERIVVAGGDGSVACAAAAAGEAGVPLAVVPVGTANDFARALDLPGDVEVACRLAVAGTRTRALELGRMGDRPFVNVASVGLPPAAARRARGAKRLLGPAAYAFGAIRAGLRARPVECTLRRDGEEVFAGSAWQVTVACTGSFGAGSSVDADPADGELDAVVVEATHRAALVARAYGLRRGTIESQRGVRSFRGRRIELDAPPETAYNVDGEVVEAGSATFTATENAFELVVG